MIDLCQAGGKGLAPGRLRWRRLSCRPIGLGDVGQRGAGARAVSLAGQDAPWDGSQDGALRTLSLAGLPRYCIHPPAGSAGFRTGRWGSPVTAR